jgi:hypothetical protein
MSIPVLVIAYQREVNVRDTIEQLVIQGVETVYLAVDGRKDYDKTSPKFRSEEIVDYCAGLGIKLHMWFRETNLGPAVSVVTAIDWFFSQETAGLILEDDLVLSPTALRFFTQALTVHSDNRKVFMISGTVFENRTINSNTVPWASYPIIWGWATWADRWILFRTFLDTQNPANLSHLSYRERSYWRNGMRRCLNGLQDAWDIPLANYQISERQITVTSPVNLITNIGSDEFAGNTFSDEWPLGIKIEELPDSYSPPQMTQLEALGCFDRIMREEIYKLEERFFLPSFLSWLCDYVRIPKNMRKDPLISRLRRVQLPL